MTPKTPSPPGTTLLRDVRRLPLVLGLAIALAFIPAISPHSAAAERMSERNAARTCQQLGGTWERDILEPGVPEADSFTCTQLLWDLYHCYPATGPFGNIVNC